MVVAASVFFASLGAIVILFFVKHWETRREEGVVLELREKADRRALELKALLMRSHRQTAKILPIAILILRFFVHEIALGMAALARLGERQAHRLADLVSHKHRFERRETKSQFLKQVADRKNENGSGGAKLDTDR